MATLDMGVEAFWVDTVDNLGLRHTQNSAWDNKTTLQGFPRGQGTSCSPERKRERKGTRGGRAGTHNEKKMRENGDATGSCHVADIPFF